MEHVERPTLAVEVDAAALAQEAQAIAASAPQVDTVQAREPPPGNVSVNSQQPLTSDPQERAAQVAPATQAAVYELARFFAPNWNVTREESAPVGDSLAMVLAYWMPDSDIHPKYIALMSLAMSSWAVVSARRDPETGALLPMRAVRKQEQQQPAMPPAANTLQL